MDIGHKIAELRELNKLTQKELADKLHLSQSAIAYYETNKKRPSIETLKLMAKIFKVNVSYFLEEDYNNRNEPSHLVTGTGDGSFSFDKDIPQEVREEIINYAEYLIKKHKEGK